MFTQNNVYKLTTIFVYSCMSINTFVGVAASVTNISCMTQVTFKYFIN